MRVFPSMSIEKSLLQGRSSETLQGLLFFDIFVILQMSFLLSVPINAFLPLYISNNREQLQSNFTCLCWFLHNECPLYRISLGYDAARQRHPTIVTTLSTFGLDFSGQNESTVGVGRNEDVAGDGTFADVCVCQSVSARVCARQSLMISLPLFVCHQPAQRFSDVIETVWRWHQPPLRTLYLPTSPHYPPRLLAALPPCPTSLFQRIPQAIRKEITQSWQFY